MHHTTCAARPRRAASLPRRLAWLAPLPAALLGATMQAQAQTPTPTPTAVAAADTVVVTGQRAPRTSSSSGLALTVQETPQSITLVDREQIELQSLFSVDQVMRNVVGVSVGFWDTQRPLYFARGFQITDFQVNGIPTYSGSTNQEYDTAFYERVEVVRGATGLLSGAGLPSATVNLVRKRPTGQLGASVALSAGSWGLARAVADLDLPLSASGWLRSRLVAVYQDSESYLDRYHEKKAAWMGVLEADIAPGSLLSLGHQTQDNDPQGSTWGTIPRFAADGSLAHLPRSTSLSPSWTYWKRNSATSFITLDQRLGAGWRAQATVARTEGDVDSLRVYGSGFPDMGRNGAGIRLLAGVGLGADVRDNVDVQISGPLPLPGQRHEAVLGYSRNRLTGTTHVLSSVASWSYTIPDLSTWAGNAPRPSYAATGARRVAVTDQSGLYGTVRWRFGDAAVITGARVSQWQTWTDNFSASGSFTGRTGAYQVDDELTPYLGLVWTLGGGWSAYASHTGIFRPQNYRNKDNQPLAPVTGSSTELGAKAALLEGRLNLSAALFKTVQDNLAVRDNSQPEGSLPDGGSAYRGTTGTSARGVELEVSGQLAPGWSVQGGYTFTRTRRHASDLIYANLPDHYVQLNSRWQLPGALSAWTVGAGLNAQSRVTGYGVPVPAGTTTTVTQAAYALVNAFASWRISPQLTASASVNNLLDKTYWSTLDYPNVGQPRSVNASLQWRL